MTLHDNGYTFKPHERPFIPGSPASPTHSTKRKMTYVLIGFLLIFCAGLQNGFMLANLAQVRGYLALDMVQSGWVQSAYFMGYSVMGLLWFKIRQHYSLQKFIRWSLLSMLIANVLQVLATGFELEVFARVIIGVGTSGMMTLGMFYMMQAFPPAKVVLPLAMGASLMQMFSTVCYLLSPALLADGNVANVFIFQLSAVLIALSAVLYLPLPPSVHQPTLKPLDWASFSLFAVGIALIFGFLTLGNTVWWTTDWLGAMLAIGVFLVGLFLWIESGRHKPLINWHWLSARQVFFFIIMAMLTRLFTTEQNIGAGGVITLMGYDVSQLTTYYAIIALSSLFGLIMSVVTLNPMQVRRNIIIAVFGIALGAYLDIGVSSQTPVSHFYVSQAIIAFSTFYFTGPVALEGMIRALAEGTENIASYIAVFGTTQALGAVLGNAMFGAFVTIQAQAHLQNLLSQITIGNGTITPDNYANAVQQASIDARILAYNDLFAWIAVVAGIGGVILFALWLYRRYHNINVIGKEMMKLQAVVAKQRGGG